jgi:hypothetical protein
MKRKLTSLASIALACVTLVNCTEDPEGKKSYQKAVLNIRDASSLVVLEASTGGRLKEGGSNFYKITTSGSMEEVKFVNADGTDMDPNVSSPTVDVTDVIDLNDSFLLLSGSFFVWDTLGNAQYYTALLVRKTDGAIFDFVENDIVVQKTKPGDKTAKSDNNGNIYYPNQTGITKLSVANPESITKEEFLPTGQVAEFFDITPQGVAVYKYGEGAGVTQSNGTDNIRLKKVNGGVFEIKVTGRDNNEFWLGTNGQIYFITYTWNNGYEPAIHKVVMNGDDPVIQNVWSDNTFSYPGVGHMLRAFSFGAHKIDKENSVLFIGGQGYSWEFNEATNTVTNIDLPAIEDGNIIVHSDDYYYIATGTELYKVDLDTHAYSSLLNSGDYEVYSMTVDENDNLQFSGLRFVDGKKIFAEIANDGSLEIIDEELGRSATVLQRLD